MGPVTNPNSKQPFIALSSQVKKVFWNADIGIGEVGNTRINWKARNNIYPKDAIEVFFKFCIIFYFFKVIF